MQGGVVRPVKVDRATARALGLQAGGILKAKAHVVDGKRFPSAAEAAVYEYWIKPRLGPCDSVYHHVPYPLLSLAPDEKGRAATINVDFIVKYDGGGWHAYDAKGGWKNREWRRGRLAFEATYGRPIHTVDARLRRGRWEFTVI